MSDDRPRDDDTGDMGRPPSDDRQLAEEATEVPQDRGFFAELTGVGVNWRQALLVPILAVLTALILGSFVIAFTDIDLIKRWFDHPWDAFTDTVSIVWNAYEALFLGAFGGLRAISETLVAAAPLILAGLAVGIGFRAGLFNIGVQGQMLVGGMFAAYAGFEFRALPPILHVIVALAFGAVGGAMWGAIPGLLRAKTGAHEVITTIMLNFIALRGVDYLLKTALFQAPGRDDPISQTIATSASLPRLFGFLDRSDIRVHAGILVALAAAWFIYWLLFKSTIGFEFRAVGQNPHGAHYAGMSVTWIYVSVMAVSGALGGLAGSNEILGVLNRATPGFAGTIGFDAIALALLGRSHPAGIVAAGLLFGALRAGGQEMQVVTDVPIDLILVLQALIVVFIAAPALIRAIYRVRTEGKAAQVSKGWAT